MTIVSLTFVLLVAVTSLLYFIVPKKVQWVVLLIGSYVFFFANSEWLLLVHVATSLFTFLMARWIHAVNQKGKDALKASADLTPADKKALKEKTKRSARRVLTLATVVVLGVLLFLKYFNFFASSTNQLLPFLKLPQLKLLLPLGISFYTLQAVAYLMDVYRGKYEPDTNPFKFMLFMSFFPQIVQGPIARHNHLANQLYAEHSFDSTRCVKGIQLMAWGWFKKMVIADRVAVAVNEIFGNSGEYGGWMILLAAVGYGLQVYGDFSGGMDVARGVSQIFGIDLELNFRQPYFARSIEEFWRRWHITLGGWMRDYVFYPLSLSKVFGRMGKATMKVFGKYVGKRIPAFLAMFIVYFLVGFWHGADMKYIVYGVWNGLFIVAGILLEDTYKKVRTTAHIDDLSWPFNAFRMIRTFCLCSIGRLFSRADSLNIAWSMLGNLFGKTTMPVLEEAAPFLGLSTGNWWVLLAAVIILLVVDVLHERNVQIRDLILKQNVVIRFAIYYAVIIILLVFGMYGPGYDSASFIYEQF